MDVQWPVFQEKSLYRQHFGPDVSEGSLSSFFPSPPFISILFHSQAHGEEQGEDSSLFSHPLSSHPLSRLQLLMRLGWCWGSCSSGSALSLLLPPELEGDMTTAGKQGQAAGLWQLTGQGRVCFCAAIRRGVLLVQRELKMALWKPSWLHRALSVYLGPAALAGRLLSSEQSWVTSVPSICSEGTSPLLGSEPAGGHSHFKPFSLPLGFPVP